MTDPIEYTLASVEKSEKKPYCWSADMQAQKEKRAQRTARQRGTLTFTLIMSGTFLTALFLLIVSFFI